MLSVVEQVFGIAPGRGVLQRPAPLPLSRALDRISCIDAAEYNFWYGELYAAATGRKQPSPATITSFGSVSIDPTLLQQIAGPPPIHHHKAPAALYQSKSAQAKLPAIGKHQDLPEIERRLHAQAQKQLDIQDKQAAYDNQRQIIQAIAPWIGFYATLFNTSTIPRISAFLGNAGEESWAFTRLVEDLEYTSASSIARTFGIQSTKAAEPYVNNPEALANYVYSGERARFLGNGPFGNGNGWRYRGRGLLQITGLYNYTQFSKSMQIDFVKNPDLVAEPQYAVASALWYWGMRHLNHYADNYDFISLIHAINPGGLNMATREANRKLAARTIMERMLHNAG